MRWAYGNMRAFMAHGKRLLFSRSARRRSKFAAFMFGSGYIMISLLLLTSLLGMLSLLAGFFGVGPETSDSYSVAQFIFESLINLLLTCGFLVSSIVAGFSTGFGNRNIAKLIVASFTVGVICMFFVLRGLITAWIGKPMKWFMLKKAGNEQVTG
jgi:hypothetical protein